MLESLSDVRGFLSAVDNEERQSLVIQVIEAFEKRVQPQMDSLQKGLKQIYKITNTDISYLIYKPIN